MIGPASDPRIVFDLFKASAPVCLCTPPCGSDATPWCGPQRRAHRARTVLENDFGWTFPPEVDTAISHALAGEGRNEFDAVVSTVRTGWEGADG